MTRILSVIPSSVKNLLKFILIVLCAVLATYGQTRYSITELTLRGGSRSNATSINDEGQVTGGSDSSQHPGGVPHAFLYKHHKIYDIGVLPGGTYSLGTVITRSGLIAGWSTAISSPSVTFLYYNGRMVPFDIDGISFASMNNFGVVVGNKDFKAVLYSHGKVINLGVLPGRTQSFGYAINDWGEVTGVCANYLGQYADNTGFIYSRGKMYRMAAIPGAFQTQPNDINNFGQVTGGVNTWPSYSSPTPFHAFLYSWGKMTDIGTFGGAYSEGHAINDRGQVVGQATTIDNIPHAFLYQNGKMIDLNDLIPAGSGWVLDTAYDINDAGQIVGHGTRYGTGRAFLLTPIGRK